MTEIKTGSFFALRWADRNDHARGGTLVIFDDQEQAYAWARAHTKHSTGVAGDLTQWAIGPQLVAIIEGAFGKIAIDDTADAMLELPVGIYEVRL